MGFTVSKVRWQVRLSLALSSLVVCGTPVVSYACGCHNDWVLKLTLPKFSPLSFHNLISLSHVFLFPYQSRISFGVIATRKEIFLSFHCPSHIIVSDFHSLCFQWCVVGFQSGDGGRS